MDREAQHATVHGVARSQTWLSDWTELTTLKFCLVLLHSFTILTRSPEYFCSFYINISFFTLRIHVVEIFLFSNLKNKSLFFFFYFFLPDSLPLSASWTWRELRPYSGLGYGLMECCGLFDLLFRPLKLSLYPQ